MAKLVCWKTHPPQGLPGVAKIAYNGWFPFADLEYGFEGAPTVEIALEAFGSYVPHRPNDSDIPALGSTWRFKNSSAKPVQVSLTLSVVNPLGEECREITSGNLRIVESGQGREGLALAALDTPAVSITGGTDAPETLRVFWDEFRRAQPKFARADKGQRVAQVINFSLPPGEEKSQRFVVGWYFPSNEENGTGSLIGHRYEAWTDSPHGSVQLLAHRFDDSRKASANWRDTLRDASWPEWVSHWLCNNQYTISKYTWWTKDGRFMTYESPECPNGSPIHIIDFADWPVVDEFPELELRLLRQFAENQGKDGRIPE